MRNQLFTLVLLTSLLAACAPTGEGNWVPIAPAPGGGESAPAPPPAAPPIPVKPQPTIAPTMMPIQDPGNIPGVQETHAAASEEDCRKMAKTFAAQGRRIQLVRTVPNNGTVLPWICVFQGPDASTDAFQDKRSR